jgi:hypothetical protein
MQQQSPRSTRGHLRLNYGSLGIRMTNNENPGGESGKLKKIKKCNTRFDV